MEEVRPGFRAFVARTFGEEGRAWLAGLPELSALAAERWGLRLGDELPGGVLSLVRAVTTADGSAAVLKVAGRWDRPRDEALSLRLWAGTGAPRLLDADPDRGLLLLERVLPGTQAPDADPAAVASLLRALHVPPPPGLRGLEDVVRERLAQAVAQRGLSADRAARGAEALAALAGDAPQPVLLHGDLDERNVLRCATRGLAAIDPLPCAGDPAYDAALWAHASGRGGRVQRQAALAATLDLDPRRVRRWGTVVALHG